MSIEVVEVGDDDRNRKCNGEYAGDDAHGTDQLAPDSNRRDVAVADSRHRHDRPPERTRDRRQLSTGAPINNKLSNLLVIFCMRSSALARYKKRRETARHCGDLQHNHLKNSTVNEHGGDDGNNKGLLEKLFWM